VKNTEKIGMPKNSTRWTARPERDWDCCEKHRREKRADDRKRQIAEARRAKWSE